MFDAHNMVIAGKLKHGDHILPLLLIRTVAERTEHPRAVDLIAVMLGIENAVDLGIAAVDAGILCMEMEHSAVFADVANGFYRVDTLPNEVGRIEVCAEARADGITELHKGFGIIDAEAGVHFESDLINAVLCGIFGLFLPIRDEHVVPLVIEDMEKILRPRASDPVRSLIFGRTTGAAGESNDHRNFEFVCENAGTFEIFMEFCSDLFIGMDGVAMGRKCRNFDIVLFKEILECL